MPEAPQPEAQDHEFEEIAPEAGPPSQHLELSDLYGVKMALSVDLGASHVLVREILDWKKGSVVALDKMAGEMTDVYVNGLLLAKGEVVVIGDILHVRISEILGAGEGLDAKSP